MKKTFIQFTKLLTLFGLLLNAGCGDESENPDPVENGNDNPNITENSGDPWTPDNEWESAFEFEGDFIAKALFVNPNNGDVMAGTLKLNKETADGVYLTKDDGDNWSKSNSGLSGPALNVNSFVNIGTKIYIGTGTASASGSGGGVFVSENNGASWTEFNSGLSQDAANKVDLVFKKGNTLFMTSGSSDISSRGIYRFQDGKWEHKIEGIPATNARDINDAIAAGNRIVIATSDGIYYSDNNGDSWNLSKEGLIDGSSYFSVTFNGEYLFTSSAQGYGNYRAKPAEMKWSQKNSGLSNGDDKRALDLLSDGRIVIAATNSKIFISEDDGDNWKRFDNGLGSSSFRSAAVKNNTLFAGSADGKIWKLSRE